MLSVLSVCHFLSHTELTELTEVFFDASLFCDFRGFCVPFIRPTDIRVHLWPLCAIFFPHTELTELTEIISHDVNIFRAFRGSRVPLSDPLISVSSVCLFLSHTELTELTEIIILALPFPSVSFASSV